MVPRATNDLPGQYVGRRATPTSKVDINVDDLRTANATMGRNEGMALLSKGPESRAELPRAWAKVILLLSQERKTI